MSNSKKDDRKLTEQGGANPVVRIVFSILLVVICEIILISYAEFGMIFFFQEKQLPPATGRAIFLSALIFLYVFAGLVFGFFLETYLTIHVALAGTLLFTILKMFGSLPVYSRSGFYIFEYLIIPVFYILGIYVYYTYKLQLFKSSTPEKLAKVRKYSYYGMSFLVIFNLAMIASFVIQMHRLPGYQSMREYQVPIYEGADNIRESYYWYRGYKAVQYETQLDYPSTLLVDFYDAELNQQEFSVSNPDDGWTDTEQNGSETSIQHIFFRLYEHKTLEISLLLRVIDKNTGPGTLSVEIMVHPFILKDQTEESTDE